MGEGEKKPNIYSLEKREKEAFGKIKTFTEPVTISYNNRDTVIIPDILNAFNKLLHRKTNFELLHINLDPLDSNFHKVLRTVLQTYKIEIQNDSGKWLSSTTHKPFLDEKGMIPASRAEEIFKLCVAYSVSLRDFEYTDPEWMSTVRDYAEAQDRKTKNLNAPGEHGDGNASSQPGNTNVGQHPQPTSVK